MAEEDGRVNAQRAQSIEEGPYLTHILLKPTRVPKTSAAAAERHLDQTPSAGAQRCCEWIEVVDGEKAIAETADEDDDIGRKRLACTGRVQERDKVVVVAE
jgi:hypothetical protein